MKNNGLLQKHQYICFGSNGLIGRETCEFIKEHGGKIIGVDKSAPKNKSMFSEFHEIDITNPDALHKFFTALQKKANKKDHFAFINCSYPRTKKWGTYSFEDVSMEEWNQNIEMQLGAPFLISKYAVAFLKKTGGGSIINLGSIYGVNGPNMKLYQGTEINNPVIYSAAKTGLIGLTKYIATVFGKDNIRANLVCPGGVFDGHSKTFVKNYESLTPLKRMARPQDIAPSIAMMGSRHFSYVSGQVLMVDGGWSAW